jgi:hypothetical protein
MERGYGLSERGLYFLVVIIAAMIWIAAIAHAIKHGTGWTEDEDEEDEN